MRIETCVASCLRSVAFALTVILAAATSDFSARASERAGPSDRWPLVAGPARVLDGDTLELDTTDARTGLRRLVRIRLEGIDAPEGGQRCNRRLFGVWDCGQAALHALRVVAEDRHVMCEDRGPDKYQRTLGICFVDGRDINAAMVRAGLAWAFVRYSDAYVAEEAEARAGRRGVWQAETMTPWDWRAEQKRGSDPGRAETGPGAPVERTRVPPVPAAAAQPMAARGDAGEGAAPGCTIKGNVTRNGRIYHTVDSPWYDRVRMSLGLGRRWFCSEDEAQRAGWRRALAGRNAP